MKKSRVKPKKVLVCLSGGVDSSVSAALLVKQGYEVVGAYMKQWGESKELSGVCSWKEDRRDALRVAAHLGIPCVTLDFEKEYREMVVKYMFSEYKKGRTPNPDVMCNKFVKFGSWLLTAQKMGFDALATGHYARIRSFSSGDLELLEACDKEKDQTYFLHMLRQEQLQKTLFPIGEYTKKQVRAMAKKWNLPTADRAESMGICFIGEVPMKQFLKQKLKPKKGKIVSENGEVLGIHDGLPFYTIGQRHGVSGVGGGKPLYVTEKNFKKNELRVGFEDDPLLFSKKSELLDLHLVSGQVPKFPLQCKVRLRHRQPFQNGVVKKEGKKVFLYFETPQKAVTPGQFAVFYKNGVCLGGGVIA